MVFDEDKTCLVEFLDKEFNSFDIIYVKQEDVEKTQKLDDANIS